MFLATHTGILTSARSTSPRGLASPLTERSPTTPPVRRTDDIRSFGARLEPRYIFGAESLDQ
jgi:hypothetical protein